MDKNMTKNFDERLGECMRTMREAEGKTIVDVARIMKVSKVSVHYWETGKRSINASALKAYCSAIGVKVQSVFDMMEER